MSRPNTVRASDPLPSGNIRFYNNYETPLEAGDYTISVQQHVQNKPDSARPRKVSHLTSTFPPPVLWSRSLR